jgi:hypothetical protein
MDDSSSRSTALGSGSSARSAFFADDRLCGVGRLARRCGRPAAGRLHAGGGLAPARRAHAAVVAARGARVEGAIHRAGEIVAVGRGGRQRPPRRLTPPAAGNGRIVALTTVDYRFRFSVSIRTSSETVIVFEFA